MKIDKCFLCFFEIIFSFHFPRKDFFEKQIKTFCSDMDAAINFPCFDVCWQEEGGKKIDVLGKNCQVTSLLLAIEFNHLCL